MQKFSSTPPIDKDSFIKYCRFCELESLAATFQNTDLIKSIRGDGLTAGKALVEAIKYQNGGVFHYLLNNLSLSQHEQNEVMDFFEIKGNIRTREKTWSSYSGFFFKKYYGNVPTTPKPEQSRSISTVGNLTMQQAKPEHIVSRSTLELNKPRIETLLKNKIREKIDNIVDKDGRNIVTCFKEATNSKDLDQINNFLEDIVADIKNTYLEQVKTKILESNNSHDLQLYNITAEIDEFLDKDDIKKAIEHKIITKLSDMFEKKSGDLYETLNKSKRPKIDYALNKAGLKKSMDTNRFKKFKEGIDAIKSQVGNQQKDASLDQNNSSSEPPTHTSKL